MVRNKHDKKETSKHETTKSDVDDDVGGIAVRDEATKEGAEQGRKHCLGWQHTQERHTVGSVLFIELFALPLCNEDEAVHTAQQHVCFK